MSERLTEERLASLDFRLREARGHAKDNSHQTVGVTDYELELMLAELRARRAADLNAEDVEALREFRECFGGSSYSNKWKRALALLERIASSGGSK